VNTTFEVRKKSTMSRDVVCISSMMTTTVARTKEEKVPACHRSVASDAKKGGGARGDKRACQQTFNLRDRQLIQGMYENRKSPGLKVVKRNSDVIRNQENVLKTRSVAIPTL
jgi:hypothetical protein